MNSITVFLTALVVVWITINAIYRVAKKTLSGRVDVELYYYSILVIRKRDVIKPRKQASRILPYVVIALYIVALVLSVYTLTTMIYAGLFRGEKSAVILLPGLNITGDDLFYFILAVGIAVILHEYLHAKLAIDNNVPVKSYGFILALIIPGAFVELDEEVFEKTSKKRKLAVLAAGVAINLVVALIALGLMQLIVSPTGFTIVSVGENTLAQKAGLLPGDVVYEINGMEATLIDLRNYMLRNESLTLKLKVYRSGVGFIEVEVEKKPDDHMLGVSVAPAPSRIILTVMNPLVVITLVRILLWVYIVNYGITFINALPLFVTDGGRIIVEIMGKKSGSIINYISLITLIMALIFGTRL